MFVDLEDVFEEVKKLVVKRLSLIGARTVDDNFTRDMLEDLDKLKREYEEAKD